MKCEFGCVRIKLTQALRALVCGCLVVSPSCVSSRLDGSNERVKYAVTEKLGAEVTSSPTVKARQIVNARLAVLLAEPLTTESAVQIALLNNQRLQADLALLDIAQADLVQAGLFKNPVFSGALRWAPGSERIIDFGIAQDFLDIVLTPLRLSVAEAELEAVEQQVIRNIFDLALRTRQGLIRYQSAVQQVELWENVLEAQEASYELAERMGEAGNLNEVEITNERVLLEQSRIDATAAAMREQTERERLNQLLGLWGTITNWTTRPRLPELPDQWTSDPDFEQSVVAASRELMAGRAQLEAAAKRVGLEQILQALPMIEIGGSAEAEKERAATLARRRRLNDEKLELADKEGSVEWWGGPTLSIPVPIFDLGQAAKARALAEMRRMWDQLTAHAVELRAVARNTNYRTAVAHQQAVYYRDVIVPLRHKLTSEVMLRYNAMSTSPFDLLGAKRGEIDAGRRYIEASEQFWLAKTELDGLRIGVEIGDLVGNGGMQAMTSMHDKEH